MPGDMYLTDYDYGAGFGYAPTSGAGQTQLVEGDAGHGSFVVWLIVFALGSVMILHGLRLGGFTFVFKR